ncbi:hypothetical protein ACKGJO_06470 [Gracilimonas sp. Q87]|uniref:hypothetical protein n=1 Tax=Gracilimonas sp. Q87 TaxID=3384766 RepID=UPI0039842301
MFKNLIDRLYKANPQYDSIVTQYGNDNGEWTVKFLAEQEGVGVTIQYPLVSLADDEEDDTPNSDYLEMHLTFERVDSDIKKQIRNQLYK